MCHVILTSRKFIDSKHFLDLSRVDRHFSGNHQNDEDEAKESYLWVLVRPLTKKMCQFKIKALELNLLFSFPSLFLMPAAWSIFWTMVLIHRWLTQRVTVLFTMQLTMATNRTWSWWVFLFLIWNPRRSHVTCTDTHVLSKRMINTCISLFCSVAEGNKLSKVLK